MFNQAHHFSINAGQFIFNSSPDALYQPFNNHNATITYERIKLATPTAPSVFIGRDELVNEAVKELCQNRQAHIAILGAGGMGKTALALHILRQGAVKEKFKDKIYFVPCDMFHDASSLIQGLVQALKLTVTEGHGPYDTFESYLVYSQTPMIIVLDNFETPWHTTGGQNAVLNLIEWIMSQELVSIVLTMRASDGPGSQKWYKLGGQSGLPTLDLDAARQAFMLISNSRSENVYNLDWLLREVDCMPLAILLIAQLKKHLSLDTLIRKWRTQKTKMLKTGAQSSRQTNLSTSVDISLEMLLRSPNNECVRILPVLSFLPNGVPLWQETLPKLVLGSGIDLEMSVVSLLESALIYEENRGLKMLSPIREDLQAKYPTWPDDLTQIGRYYVKLLRQYSPGKGQDVIEAHCNNITKILGTQIQSLPQQEYLEALYDFTKYRKFSPLSVELIETALVAQRWDDNFEEEIMLRFAKEERLCWMGSYQRAIEELRVIQIRLKDVPTQQSKAASTAKCLQCLGNIYYLQNRYPEAKSLLKHAGEQFSQIHNMLGVAQCLQNLGDLGVARILESLGDICRVKNEYNEARLLLTDAKAQFEHIGDQLGVAQCLRGLGNICRMQDEYSDAKSLLTNAKTQFEEVADQLGVAHCLQNLAYICRMQDKYYEAKLLITDAKSRYEKIGNQLGVAQCLGNISRMEKEYSDAKLLLTSSKTQFEKIGYELGVAQCLQSLGETSTAQSEISEAISFLSDARTQFEKVGSQLGVAQCLHCLGEIFIMQNEYSVSKSLLIDAKTQFQKLGNQIGVAQCLQSLQNFHIESAPML